MPYAARRSWTILRSRAGRHADRALEHPRQVRLVAEPARGRDRRRRIAGGEQRAGAARSAGRAGTRAAAGRPARGTSAPARSGSARACAASSASVTGAAQRSSRYAPRAPHRRVLGPRPRPARPRPQVRPERVDRRDAPPRRPPAPAAPRASARCAPRSAAPQRRVAEHHPARRLRRRVLLRPRADQRRVEVEHLVRPAARRRRDAGVHRLGLEHEQLAVAARWSVSSSANAAAPRSIIATVQVGCECGRYACVTKLACSASTPLRPRGPEVGRGSGARRSERHSSPSRRYRMRSCSRLGRPCQNSIASGRSR